MSVRGWKGSHKEWFNRLRNREENFTVITFGEIQSLTWKEKRFFTDSFDSSTLSTLLSAKPFPSFEQLGTLESGRYLFPIPSNSLLVISLMPIILKSKFFIFVFLFYDEWNTVKRSLSAIAQSQFEMLLQSKVVIATVAWRLIKGEEDRLQGKQSQFFDRIFHTNSRLGIDLIEMCRDSCSLVRSYLTQNLLMIHVTYEMTDINGQFCNIFITEYTRTILCPIIILNYYKKCHVKSILFNFISLVTFDIYFFWNTISLNFNNNFALNCTSCVNIQGVPKIRAFGVQNMTYTLC